MSTFEIKMPKLGESITEGTIVNWNVKAGDIIKEDDILFEVSTAKVSAEIPSPVGGKLLEILFKEGDTVPVGTVVAIIQLERESIDSEEKKETPEKLEENKPTAEMSQPETQISEPVKKNKESNSEKWYSPAVLRIAREANISFEELDKISGSGYLGRLSKKDIESYINNGKQKKAQPATIPTITQEKEIHSTPVSTESKQVVHQNYSGGTIDGTGDEIKEMDRVRRIIADHMVMSKKVSPHVTTIIEADVTNLVRWREKNKDAFMKREGINLTFMPAFTEATAKALKDFPQVNASVDGYNIILKKHINIGIAVALNDGNLIVPVIYDADKLNIEGLASSIEVLASKARSNKLIPDDIQGGTFTITNFGTFKNIIGTPIINQPQAAILGVGYIQKKPAVVETPQGDMIAIRNKMYLSLSYDHRLIDGSLGGAFVQRIAQYLENWKE